MTRSSSPPDGQLWSNTGEEVRLGVRLGGGGEGEVFEVAGYPEFAAKVYTRAVPEAKLAKLVAMREIGRSHPALRKVCAWPVATLHRRTATGHLDGLRGLVMPKVSARKEIHHLTSPPTRKKDFPDKGWAFQIHVAKNLSASIETIHAARVVVGDINERGFLVGPDGTIRVIDCDSFQVDYQGHVFRCEVGVPDYTPPELQAMSGGFGTVTRTTNHDAFGLAVIIFKLLFQGRHPFMGIFSGSGDPDLQRFIRECRFAYGRGAGTKRIAPPPHSLPFGALTRRVSELFERAFGDSRLRSGRPSPGEWHAGLHELQSALTTCSVNTTHEYMKGLPRCSWCELEQGSGIIFFYGRVARGEGWSLNVSYFSAAVARLPELTLSPLVFPPATVQGAPIPEALRREVLTARAARYAFATIGVAVGGGLALLSDNPLGLLVGGALGVVGWYVRIVPERLRVLVKQREGAVKTALQRAEKAKAEWTQLPVAKYHEERQQLLRELRDYAALDSERTQGLAKLEREKREGQLQDHLDDFNIRDEKIRRVGPARLSTLASWNIFTAADVTREKLSLLRGKGFGPAAIETLLAWRRTKEALFRFDASKPIDQRSLASLMQRLQTRRQQLETSMNRKLATLTQLFKAIDTTRAQLLAAAPGIGRQLGQAEADLAALKGLGG